MYELLVLGKFILLAISLQFIWPLIARVAYGQAIPAVQVTAWAVPTAAFITLQWLM